MNAIRRLIGDNTYYELQNIDPYVFPVMVEPSIHRSDYTDVVMMFVDTDYTPEDLLKDFKLILASKQPINPEALKLVDGEPYYTKGWNPCTLELIIFIIIGFIFWMTVIYTLSVIFFETPSIRNTFIRQKKIRY